MYFLNGLMFGILRGISLGLVTVNAPSPGTPGQHFIRETGFATGIVLGSGVWITVVLVLIASLIFGGPYGFHGAP
jgi:hypothetical protein